MKMLEMVCQGNQQGGDWNPPVNTREQAACNGRAGFQGEYDRAKHRLFEPEVWLGYPRSLFNKAINPGALICTRCSIHGTYSHMMA